MRDLVSLVLILFTFSNSFAQTDRISLIQAHATSANFSKVDIPPLFPDGLSKFDAFLRARIRNDDELTGQVTATLIIEKMVKHQKPK